MLFNSLAYAVFLPVALAGYFLLPERWRNLWLLAASCFFYMVYQPAYILVLATLIAIDYFAGLAIGKAPAGRLRRAYLMASIGATCLALFAFKYYGFISGNMALLSRALGIPFAPGHGGWPLPIGLSFHTFQSLAYVIEVYGGRQSAERDPVVYATYVMFFPQLVAGPIERPGNMLHQFRERHTFDAERVEAGLRRIVWGLFKKCVIADRLALLVNDVYADPGVVGGVHLTAAAVAFSYQIYCDFSGYSDIAVGSAQLLGFRLTENFATPFCAASLSEFWRRWHISLTTWFRDYVFIPLGGSRGTRRQTARNLLFTFALSGLWHGADWTFVLWGLVNGAAVVAGRLTGKNLLGRLGGVPMTFAFVTASFVLFRAASLSEALYFYMHFFRDWSWKWPETGRFDLLQWQIAIPAIALLEAAQWFERHPAASARFQALFSPGLRRAAYLSFALSIPIFGIYFGRGTFVYFQF